MALIKCPECGKDVSDRAPTCIHCGYPLSQSTNYELLIDGYYDTDTAAMAGLKVVLQLDLEYDETMEIFNNCPYKIAEFEFKEEAIACAKQLKEWGIVVRIVSPSGNSIYVEELNSVKCPSCSSINVSRISDTEKVLNIALFGILGNRRKKTFHCNHCKYEW